MRLLYRTAPPTGAARLRLLWTQPLPLLGRTGTETGITTETGAGVGAGRGVGVGMGGGVSWIWLVLDADRQPPWDRM